ncbi:MAG TPA: hypothetical protein VL295_02795 [Gemmatimonadales bacterium]|nr:hypothetical protein [Gemmatimonadales bacterium]
MTTFRRRLASVCALILAIACSDGQTGPTESADGRIDLDQATLVDFAAGDTSVWLTLEVEPDSYYVLAIAPKSGGIYISPFDSAKGSQIGYYVQVNGASPAALRFTPVLRGPAHGSIAYRIDPSPFGSAARAVITAQRVPADPEHVAAGIALGDSIAGEALDSPTDVDIFTFTGSAGQIIEPKIHIPGPAGVTGSICANVSAPNGAHLGAVSGFPGDTVLTDIQGGRIHLPADGIYQVRVNSGRNGCFGWGGFDPYTGPFALVVAEIDPAPESASASLTAGDTVTAEAIDQVGDIDEFTIHGAPGSMVIFHFRTLGDMLRFEVPGAEYFQYSMAGDTSWLDRTSGRITLPESGEVTVTFSGFSDGPGGSTGPYQFFVRGIDPAPESVPAAVTYGEVVTGETIDTPGDLDRFTFSGTAGQLANVHLSALGAPPGGTLALQLYAPNGATVGPEVVSTVADQDSVDRATGRQPLPSTGTYTIEVRGLRDGHRDDVGAFRIAPRLLDPHPESLPDTFDIADSLVGESLDEWGDIDDFYFTIADSVWIEFGVGIQALNGVGGAIRISVTDVATGDTLAFRQVLTPAYETTNPVPAHPATYRLRVEGVGDPEPPSGPYVAQVYTFPLSGTAPVGAVRRNVTP